MMPVGLMDKKKYLLHRFFLLLRLGLLPFRCLVLSALSALLSSLFLDITHTSTHYKGRAPPFPCRPANVCWGMSFSLIIIYLTLIYTKKIHTNYKPKLFENQRRRGTIARHLRLHISRCTTWQTWSVHVSEDLPAWRPQRSKALPNT